jgi:DNA-binding transcriptional regulator YiaG
VNAQTSEFITRLQAGLAIHPSIKEIFANALGVDADMLDQWAAGTHEPADELKQRVIRVVDELSHWSAHVFIRTLKDSIHYNASLKEAIATELEVSQELIDEWARGRNLPDVYKRALVMTVISHSF